MLLFTSHRSFENPFFKNTFYTVLYGILSCGLSLVGIEEMNLREIPLLICLIHLTNFGYVFILTLFTLFNAPEEIPLWAVYGAHLLPLMAAWLSFKFLERKKFPNIILGLTSILITLGYYLLFLLPLVIVVISMFAPDGKSFWESYVAFLPLSSFEVIASSLVISFYVMQLEIKKTLEHNNKNLALVVEERTIELTSANNELLSLNEELKSSNDSIKELNENLERMVQERTDKINAQLKQLSKYIHMNSHEVRAPLARMLGLMQLIKHQDIDANQKIELLDMLYNSSLELDTIVKEMNRLLEKERPFNEK